MHHPGVHAPQQVDRDPADESRDETDQRAETEPQHAGGGVRRGDGGDRRRTVLGVADRADRQDVVLQQLENDAELETGRDVAEDRAGDGAGDERPRDHDLRQAHEVDPDERAPGDQRDEDLCREVHVNSPIGTARAVGTSCAVTSTPRAASCLSFAASSSVRYTKRSRSLRPARWGTPPTVTFLPPPARCAAADNPPRRRWRRPARCGTPPTFSFFTPGARLASATAVSTSPTSRMPTRESASHSRRCAAACSTEANTTSMSGGTPMR